MKLALLESYCRDNGISCKRNEPMKHHTTFKIGGEAELFLTVETEQQLSDAVCKARELGIACFPIGRGSNLLVSDEGLEGAVISLAGLDTVTVSGEELICGAGASLSAVCRAALRHSLSGLEFAYGIPGSLGGAVFMNAGAYGGQMADVVESVRVILPSGEWRTVPASEAAFGYRTSCFKKDGSLIAGVRLRLQKGEADAIEAKMNELIERRRSKQPLEYPSAGSVFKRPEGHFAGALIEKNNLKGKKIGDAMVSEKHAGFIVNCGNATACDVKKLIAEVQKTVLAADGVQLEPEIISIGK